MLSGKEPALASDFPLSDFPGQQQRPLSKNTCYMFPALEPKEDAPSGSLGKSLQRE